MYNQQNELRKWVLRVHSVASIPYTVLSSKMGISVSLLRMFVAGERNLSDEKFYQAKTAMKQFRQELLEIL